MQPPQGIMTFQLPAGGGPLTGRDLERACLAGGPDNMPWPTDLRHNDHHLSLQNLANESGGFLVVPWEIAGAGRLMGTSATLMSRAAPYGLVLELARGKVNQLRNQAADWQAAGLKAPDDLTEQVRQASLLFGHALTAGDPAEADRRAGEALVVAYTAAERLVLAYCQQVLQARHERQARFDTALSCRVGPTVPPARPHNSFEALSSNGL